jgi:hypothetical protein
MTTRSETAVTSEKEEPSENATEAPKHESGSVAGLQLSLLPSGEDRVISDIVSTERNYDRWANFIFPHTKSPDLKEIRKKEWDLELPNGKNALASRGRLRKRKI